MGSSDDEVTAAALEVVSQAVDLADEEARKRERNPARRLAARYSKQRLARRGDERAAERGRQAERERQVRRIRTALGEAATRSARAAGQGARTAGRGLASGSRWLSDRVLAMAPRLPVRDLTALREQFPGHAPDELADALIEGAARASAAIGVAAGTWAVVPFLPAAGAEIVTETLAVVGIEIKLVAELHEVYGQRAPGGVIERMTAYVGAWSQRRGVALAPGGLVIAAGSPLGRQLQRRLAARTGRSVLSLGPLLTGAVAGGLVNRRETRKLGRLLRDDLRRRSPHQAGWPD
jgi:hypothetical protein